MAIFKVSTRDGSVSLIVRACCMSCAREIAVERSPEGEASMWAIARVDLVHNPEQQGYLRDGRSGIVKRSSHGPA